MANDYVTTIRAELELDDRNWKNKVRKTLLDVDNLIAQTGDKALKSLGGRLKNTFGVIEKKNGKPSQLEMTNFATAYKSVLTRMKNINSKGVQKSINVEDIPKPEANPIPEKKSLPKLEKALSNLKKIGNFIEGGIGKPIDRIAYKTTKIINKFKGIALYRIVRKLISLIGQGLVTGINNLYQYSSIIGGSFKKNLDSLSTSALLIKNSVASMISPLVNVITPVIDAISSKFADLANNVGLFFARITNQSSYSKAVRSLKEYSKSTREVLGFDELNKLSGNNDYASMFEEVSTEYSDLMGQLSRGSVTEAIKESINSDDWESAASLLTLKLNDMISGINTESIGINIGNKINTIFGIVGSFFENLNFAELGAKFSVFINGIFETVDWVKVGETLMGRITGIFEFGMSVVRNLDWGRLSKSIGEFMVGVLNKLSEWVDKVDWESFEISLFNALRDVVTSIDWEALVRAAFNLVKSIASKLLGLWSTSVTQKLGNLHNEVSVDAVNIPSILIDGFANGGFVPQGDLFIANEAGPELVGTIGNRTAVTNQDQFVASVAGAMAPVIQAIYDTGNANVNAIANMPTPSIRIGDRDIYNASRRGSNIVGTSLVQGA